MLVPLVAIVPAVLLWIYFSAPGESSQSSSPSKSGRVLAGAPFWRFSNGTVELLLLTAVRPRTRFAGSRTESR